MDTKLSDFSYEAVELYFSAVCNLDCTYCFQPKLKEHGALVNKDLIEWIRSGEMEEDILKYVGEKTSFLSLWGGEPTINLPYLTERIEKGMLDKFPNLKQIFFSTNLSTRTLAFNVSRFIREVYEYNKKQEKGKQVKLDIQISLDGTPETNDVNRKGSSCLEIINNVYYLLNSIKDIEKSYDFVYFHFKGTFGSEGLSYLASFENLTKHYKFFEDFYNEAEKISKNIPIPRLGEFITLVFPGNWTVEDGKNLAKICKIQASPEFRSQFTNPRLTFENQAHSFVSRAIKTLQICTSTNATLFSKISGFSCSSCKHALALSPKGKMSICHHSFFFDEEAKKEIVRKDLVIDFEEKHGFSFRTYDERFKGKEGFCLSDPKQTFKILKALHAGSESMYSLGLRTQYLRILMIELSKVNQVSIDIKDERQIDLAITTLLYGGLECVVNNIWESGSYSIRNYSFMRLLFNGALEEILKTKPIREKLR